MLSALCLSVEPYIQVETCCSQDEFVAEWEDRGDGGGRGSSERTFCLHSFAMIRDCMRT